MTADHSRLETTALEVCRTCLAWAGPGKHRRLWQRLQPLRRALLRASQTVAVLLFLADMDKNNSPKQEYRSH